MLKAFGMPYMRTGDELIESKQIEWKIRNFSFLCFTHRISPSFDFDNASWHLKIQNNRHTLGAFLKNESLRPRNVTCSFSVRRSENQLVGTKTFTTDVSSEFGFSSLYNIHAARKQGILKSDDVTIVCNLKTTQQNLTCWPAYDLHAADRVMPSAACRPECKVLLGSDQMPNEMLTVDHKVKIVTEKTAIQKLEEPLILAETDVLSSNLKDLFINEDCCDIVLQVTGKKFKAHRAILMARSPVFAAMFKHDTAEKQSGIISISDCDSDSFQKFLEYLYSGKLEGLTFDTVIHLYRISDKYCVPELKTFCTKYLAQNLTVHSLCDIICLADEYDEMIIFSSAQKFFNKNLTDILKTREWENLLKNNYRLANKLLINMSESK